MGNRLNRETARRRRHRRVRKRVSGTPDRLRLNVYRSTSNIYAQVIDDVSGHTLVAASSIDGDLRGKVKGLSKTEQASLVGRALAERAAEKGIQRVVFDSGGYLYHGRVKALADGAREGGLDF